MHKEIVKVHISATIDPHVAEAIIKYRDDPTNNIENEKPARSRIIQVALEKYLYAYLSPPRASKKLTANLINQAAENLGNPIKSFDEIVRELSNQNK